MQLNLHIAKLKTVHILIFGFILYFFVLVINDGFMALDEYWVGITRYIPAQSSSLMSLVAADDVKSPLQLLPMHLIAQTALSMGIVSPYWQYRSVIFFLGIIAFFLLFLSFIKFSKLNNFNQSETNFLLYMFIFYFAGPFVFTRPMFESVAAPWLALAAVTALIYDETEKLRDLLWGVVLASVAFVLRQQLGFCALVFILLPVFKKKWKHLLYASGVGLLFFIIAGIPDYFIRGKFHYSLLNLTLYNYEHGSDYGNRSLFFYPIFIIGAAFIPFLIKKYPELVTKNYLKKYRSLLIMLGLFIFLHSLFPQKWERFVISIIPILIFLTFPFLYYLQQNFKTNKLRLISLYALNGCLFLVASFFPAQKNLIEMSLYLDQHSEVKKIFRVANTPEWITEVFILNKHFEFIETNQEQINSVDWADCGNMLVIGQAQAASFKPITEQLKLNAQFNVNLIEQLAFEFNPKNNLRRVQLSLYSGCDR